MVTGWVGLGCMGADMARRLTAGGHRVLLTNRSHGPSEQLVVEGAMAVFTKAEPGCRGVIGARLSYQAARVLDGERVDGRCWRP